MFENLKQQGSGMRTKEKTRLTVTVGGCLLLGAAIWGAKTLTEEPPPKPTQAPSAAPAAPAEDLHDLDLGPLAAIRAGTADPARFDAKALDHVLREVAGGKLRRDPKAVLEPKEVLALDPKATAGTLLEVTGTIRSLDKEEYASKDNPLADRLWAFGLEGADGSRVVVVQGGLGSDPDGGRPADRSDGSIAPRPLEDGNRVRVRGVYLQTRTGPVGALTLDAPTPVLVGREYRLTVVPPPPPASIADADWAHVQDRFMEQTQRVDDDVHYQLLQWMRARGHDAILKDLKSGALPVQDWGRDAFFRFRAELEKDTDPTAPDPRAWTTSVRGKVFTTTGVLADYVQEDWANVGPNLYDVGSRSKYWVQSDFYANALLMMDSAFPLKEFADVPMPRSGLRPRVRVYGIFVRNFSYRPRGAGARPEREGVITVPYFMLLHIESDVPYRVAPLYENPFFWTWVSLGLFGGLFFLVMSRLEKKESAMIQATHRRIKASTRAAAGRVGAGRPAPPSAESPGGDPPAGTSPPAGSGPS